MDTLCQFYTLSKILTPSYIDIFNTYFAIIVSVFGLISNTIAIIVLSRKKLIQNPCNIFLLVISICGVISMFGSFTLLITDIVFDRYTFEHTIGWMIALLFCYVVCAIHTWVTVSLSAWRVFTLDFPLQTSLRMNHRNVAINIVIVIIFATLFHMPHLYTIRAQETVCDRTPIRFNASSDATEIDAIKIYTIASIDKNMEAIGFYSHAVAMELVPCALLLAFTVILLRKLSDALKRRQSFQKCDTYRSKGDKLVMETSHALILIFLFTLVCDIPVSVKVMIGLIQNRGVPMSGIASHISYICHPFKLINCSGILILLCITSSVFRKEFKRAFNSCVCIPTGGAVPRSDAQLSSAQSTTFSVGKTTMSVDDKIFHSLN